MLETGVTTYGNRVAGEWVPAASGKTFENRNPADRDDLIARFADSGPEGVKRAEAEACVQALEVFSEWKSIYIDFDGTLRRAQIDA